MGRVYSRDSADVTLAAGATTTLEVDAGGHSSDVVVLIDNGTSGGAPASYDLLTEVDGRGDGSYQQFNLLTGQTEFSIQEPAVGESMRYTLTNQSAASADYRITIVAEI